MKFKAEEITMKRVEKQIRGVLRIVVHAPPPWMMVRITMDLFQHRYYRLSKILMSLIGQWPYQSIRARRAILATLILPISYQMIAQILAVVKYRANWNILLECLVPNVFEAVCVTKYLGFEWNSQKTLKLLNRIRTDWEVWARDRDVNILHGYAERGEKIIILYIAVMYSGIFVFTIYVMITKLIDIVLKNGTESEKFPFPVVYYHLDMQKYYFYLIMYCTVCGFVKLTVTVSSGVMFIIYVQHVCGILAAVGHKLQRIGSDDKSVDTGYMGISPYELDKADMHRYLASCIDRHNDAIKYADLIKASYTWNFFFTTGFGMILINASGLQILLRTGDLGTTLTFTVVTLGVLFYFYVECCISQILIDHSLRIRFYIQNSQWYRLSPKAQRLLQLMTMRCNVPCRLTAGNILTISVQTFGLVFRTFMSYFAFIRSMQGL